MNMWREVKEEEEWWGEANEHTQGMVRRLLKGAMEGELDNDHEFNRCSRFSVCNRRKPGSARSLVQKRPAIFPPSSRTPTHPMVRLFSCVAPFSEV